MTSYAPESPVILIYSRCHVEGDFVLCFTRTGIYLHPQFNTEDIAQAICAYKLLHIENESHQLILETT